ncbi:hypothetical protein CAFE_28070 [Caprobacter fermentans]|uniref:Uncharacterized protein n=1 Tax=Caproicibacter fermentans TaxID=2576756 RepID=A0A6N8I1U6_9FIRM|nr:hypothetical protein [Caproicibacter fermentans]MVB12076.1 hypothetical protein [Caproicibacter fermentans]
MCDHDADQDNADFNFNKFWGPDGYRSRVVFERGSDMYCVYCGDVADTREHCPSKVFLSKPYPDDLPVVPACQKCNNGFSKDELYTKAFIEYYQNYCYYTTISVSEKRKEVREAKQKFAECVESNKIVYDERIGEILIKLSICHAAYELTEAYHEDDRSGMPEYVSYTFRPNMTQEEIDASDDFIPINDCVLPIIGSRVFNKIYVFGPALSAVESDDMFVTQQAVMDWTDVQDNHYRYVCWLDSQHINVKLVINEFLYAMVVFNLEQ